MRGRQTVLQTGIFVAAIVLMCGIAGQAMGAEIWKTYDGSVLPTAATPTWGISSDTDADGDRTISTDGNVLSVYCPDIADNMTWFIGNKGSTSYSPGGTDDFNHISATGTTVDFTYRVNDSGDARPDRLSLQVAAGIQPNPAPNWTFRIETDGITLGGVKVDMDNTDMSQIRVTYKNALLNVYDYGSATPGTPIFADVAPTGFYSDRDCIMFGDMGSGDMGSFDIDEVTWTNDGAIALPEPATMALMAFGLPLLLRRRRR